MTYANIKNGQKKGKLIAMMAEETPWNKICVDIIVPYNIGRKGKEPLILNAVTMIEPVTQRIEVTQYREKKVMQIANLV